MNQNYADKLNDPRWRKKRLEILSLADWACEDCGAKDRRLGVHHCAYIPGREPWEYESDLLMSLCDPCHLERQKFENEIRVEMGRITRRLSIQRVEDRFWGTLKERSDGDWEQEFHRLGALL